MAATSAIVRDCIPSLVGQPVELVQDVLEHGEVLGLVLREVVRMPPQVEDPALSRRVPHARRAAERGAEARAAFGRGRTGVKKALAGTSHRPDGNRTSFHRVVGEGATPT